MLSGPHEMKCNNRQNTIKNHVHAMKKADEQQASGQNKLEYKVSNTHVHGGRISGGVTLWLGREANASKTHTHFFSCHQRAAPIKGSTFHGRKQIDATLQYSLEVLLCLPLGFHSRLTTMVIFYA